MDVVVLRALVEGNDSALDATLANADRKLIAWAGKQRPAPKIVASVDTAQASRNVGQLERDLDRLRKKAVGINIGVHIPKNAARDLKDIAQILPLIKSTSATFTINRAGNADPKALRDIARIATSLQSKTVTYTVNWQQNGQPPVPPPNGPVPPGPVPPGGRPSPNPGGPSPRVSPWTGQMQGMQMQGYGNMAAGSMLIRSAMVPAGIVGGALKFAGDYEEAMQHVITLTDVAAGEIETLKRQVISLSGDPTIRQGPTELADALYYVTSTGLKGADGMKVLRASALGASAGLGDAQVVANTLTTVLDAYGLSADHAMRATDTLTQAVKFGKGEADKYAAAFPKVIAIAAQAGVSFEQVAAQMASATRLGLTPSETATALRQVFSNIIDPSEKAKKAMKEMGTSVGELRIMLKEKGLFNTLKDLNERTGGRIGPITELFGSIRALITFLSTTGNATLGEYRKTLTGIEEGSGATAVAAQTASETMNFSFDRVKASLERAGIAFGKSFQPMAEKAAKWLEKDLPAAGEVGARVWDDLGEGTQGFIINFGKLMLASGGLKILIGTLQILGSTLGSLFTVAMGIPAVASALAPLVALAANPYVLALLAGAAIIGGIAAWTGFSSAVADAAERTDLLRKNAEHLSDAFGRALSSAPSGKIKKEVQDLQTAFDKAGNNARALDEVLAKTFETKREIQELGLAPHAADPLLHAIDQILKGIESRRIHIGVQAPSPTPEQAQQADKTANWLGELTPAETGLLKKSREMGWDFPQKPARMNFPQYSLEGQTDYDEAKSKYLADLEVIRKRLKEINAEETRLAKKAYDASLAGRINNAVELNPGNQKNLLALRTEYDKSKTHSGAEAEAAGKLNAQISKNQEKIAAAHKIAVDSQKERETQDNEARIKAKEETAERMRAIEARTLQARLQAWNSFGNAVESVVKNIGTVGADKGDLQAWAMQAQMARREFAEIPKPLRDIVVGLGAINDEMRALTETRDQMRGLFSDLFKDAMRSGADLGPLRQTAAFFEKNLDYANRMKSLYGRGARGSQTVVNATEVQRSGLASRLEQLQGAGAKSGSAYDADAYVDARDSAARASTAGDKVAAVVMQRHISGASRAFVKRCQALAETDYYKAGVTAYDAILRQKGSALQTMHRFQKARVGQKFSPGMAMAPGGLLYSDTMGGGSGHVQTIGTDRARYDQYGRNKFKESNFQWYVPPPGSAISKIPANSNVANRLSATPALPVAKPRPYVAPGAPNYNGDLLQMGLPKGWGKAVTETGLAPGESRAWQLKIQEMLSDTEKSKKAAQRLGMSLDEYAATWRRIAVRRDATGDVQRATDGARKQITALSREIRMTGKEGNPFLELMDSFKNGENRLLGNTARRSLQEMTLGAMVSGTRQSTRETRRSISGDIGAYREAAPLLSGGDFNRGAYDRKLFEGQKRREIWNSQDITNLLQAGKGIEANRQAVIRLNLEMQKFDADRLQGVSAGRAELLHNLSEEGKQLAATNQLLREGALRTADIAGETEKMAYYAKQYDDYIKNGVGKATAGMMAGQDAKIWADNRAAGLGNQATQESRAYGDSAGVRRGMLANQTGLVGSYRTGDPELAIQLRLAEERARLEAENLTRSKKMQLDVAARLTSYEAEIRAEAELARLQASRQKVAELQTDALDEQKSREIALARTARERLEIEFRYEAMKRSMRAEAETAEEAAARVRLDAERALTAEQADRLEKLQAASEQVKSAFRSVFDGDMAGMRNGIVTGMKDRLAQSLADRFVKRPKLASPNQEPGLNPFVQGPPTLNILDRLMAQATGKTSAILGSTAPFVPQAQQMPTSGSGVADTLRQMLGGGITAGRVEVTAPLASVRGNTVNVAGEGGGSGLFGLLGSRSKGGGSGTTPTTAQGIESVLA